MALGSVVDIVRRASSTGWRVVKSIPTRVGRIVTFDRFGGITTPLVGVAVIVAVATYFGLI